MHELNTTEPPRVSVSMSFKRNMGNYESLGIEVGLEYSAQSGETVPDAMNRTYDFVEKVLESKFAETEAALKEAGLGE